MRGPLLFILVFLCQSLHTQPGLYASYQNLEAPYWNLLDPAGPRFFQKRVRRRGPIPYPSGQGKFFLPSQRGVRFFSSITSEKGQNRANFFQLRGSIRVFPIEFLFDCDCPGIKKGFFAEGSPDGAVGTSCTRKPTFNWRISQMRPCSDWARA